MNDMLIYIFKRLLLSCLENGLPGTRAEPGSPLRRLGQQSGSEIMVDWTRVVAVEGVRGHPIQSANSGDRTDKT